MCSDLIVVIPAVKGALQAWLSSPQKSPPTLSVHCVDDTREGGLFGVQGYSGKSGAWGHPDFAQAVKRGPLRKRSSAKCAARRLVRDLGVVPESVDEWPGVRAASEGAPGEESLEPQAEPGGECSPPSRRMELFAKRPPPKHW